VRARYLPLLVDDNRESLSASDIEERQRASEQISFPPTAAQDYLCGEGHQPVSGENTPGFGCDACDQETRAWNPSFMSMNYALSRLNRIDERV
jgi:hypothetical protein